MESMVYKKKSPLIVFLVPAFLFMTVFLYYPFIMNIINSFSNVTGLGRAAEGLNEPFYKSYVQIFQDPRMGTAFKNTLVLIFSTIVFQVGIALLLALMVDNISKGVGFFRTVYFFPIVISGAALGLLFNLIFLYQGGMLNQFLANFGIGVNEPINWKDIGHFYITLLTPIMWQYVGFYFVIFTTGLSNISQDIYEAAYIDGATGLQRVKYITLPLLHNVICTCLTLAITGALKVFDMPYLILTGGIPLDNSWLTGTYMYHVTFNMQDIDYGSAIAVIIVLLGIFIAQIVRLVLKEKDY